MKTEHETKLQVFHQWLQVNGVELPGCKIKFCDSTKGFGLFSANNVSDGVLLVVPLDLAITPMRVLEDPLMGPLCRAMFEEGHVDDRFLIILFLTVERLRNNSTWKPYLDMIPSSFGSPLWFTDDEFQELKGTTLYQATKLQKKSLEAVFEDKVKGLVKKLLTLDGDSESKVDFEDFLWANSVFWTRALNIPLPRSYVFPENREEASGIIINSGEEVVEESDEKRAEILGTSRLGGLDTDSLQGETLWVEGLVPGIDFCNHDIRAAATWEVDRTGSATGLPNSMYLITVNQGSSQIEKEIAISYGNKGNEVHYPAEALRDIPFSDSKMQLLQAQKAELRCLLPKSLLERGFFPQSTSEDDNNQMFTPNKVCSYSWSGQRKTLSYINKLVFPEEFLAALRTIAMQEDELFRVQSLLEELVGREGEREPSDSEVRAAVWEACGGSGSLQLVLDLLNKKMMDLEEGSGTDDCDTKLLEKACVVDSPACSVSAEKENRTQLEVMSKKKWSSIVYRRGQKQLTRLFLREAEYALELSLRED